MLLMGIAATSLIAQTTFARFSSYDFMSLKNAPLIVVAKPVKISNSLHAPGVADMKIVRVIKGSVDRATIRYKAKSIAEDTEISEFRLYLMFLKEGDTVFHESYIVSSVWPISQKKSEGATVDILYYLYPTSQAKFPLDMLNDFDTPIYIGEKVIRGILLDDLIKYYKE